MRCEDPEYGVTFCVISDLAVFFDSKNLNLQLNREIKFENPEKDAIFEFDEEKNEKKTRKRGRKRALQQKVTYSGVLINKSGSFCCYIFRFQTTVFVNR